MGVELTVVFTFCTWCVTFLSSGIVPRPLSVSNRPMTVMPLSPMATATEDSFYFSSVLIMAGHIRTPRGSTWYNQ